MLPRMALDELETYSAELPTAPAGDLVDFVLSWSCYGPEAE